MRVLVCGSRNYCEAGIVDHVLSRLQISTLIHGGATGADTLAGEWATKRGIPTEVYPAEWRKYGNSAGPLRNARMLKEGKPDLVIAFPGGRGTRDMVKQAHGYEVSVKHALSDFGPIHHSHAG